MTRKTAARVTDAELPETVTGRALGALTGLTDRQIRNLAAEGVVVKADRGRYLLIASATAILERARSQGTDAAAAARVEYVKTKAEAAALALAEKRRELVPVEDCNLVLDMMGAEFKNQFLGLPARFTRDLDLRRRLEAEIHDSFNRIAKKFDEAAEFVREGGDPYGMQEHD